MALKPDVNVLLDQVLPPDLDAYIQALDFFASIRQADPALAIWRRLISMGKPVALPRTFPFLDELILDDRSADAKQVWIEALTAAGLPHGEPPNHSLVWNGGFRTTSVMADWAGAGTLPSAWRLISTPRLLLPACAPCGWILVAAATWKSPNPCSTSRSSPPAPTTFMP